MMNEILESEASKEETARLLLSGHLGISLGPYIQAQVADALMLGLVLQQGIRWFFASRENGGESRWIQGLVWYSLIMSVSVSVYIVTWIMHAFVYGFGTYYSFVDNHWTSWFYVLDNIVRIPVSVFFGLRAWKMVGRSKLFGGIIVFLLTASIAGSVGGTVSAHVSASSLSAKRLTTEKESICVLVWILSEVLCDLLVTGTLAWKLFSSRTGWRSTDKLIWRLLILLAETQLPPTVFAVTFMILSITMPTGTIVAFFTCTGKVYVVCLLTVILSRYSLRAELSKSTNDWSGIPGRTAPKQSRIVVETDTYVYHHTPAQPPIPLNLSINRGPALSQIEAEGEDGKSIVVLPDEHEMEVVPEISVSQAAFDWGQPSGEVERRGPGWYSPKDGFDLV